ncbi:unnamed protein product [Prunus armeniaca]
MMQWQVNRQFRKDREAAMTRIPNPDESPLIAQIAAIPGHGEIQVGQRGRALPIQEQEGPEGPAPVQVYKNSQNLHSFHNPWPHMINPWHFCLRHQLCYPTDPEGWIPIHFLHRGEAEEADGESTPLLTMIGTYQGQTKGIIQILKKRKNIGWSTGLTTPS